MGVFFDRSKGGSQVTKFIQWERLCRKEVGMGQKQNPGYNCLCLCLYENVWNTGHIQVTILTYIKPKLWSFRKPYRVLLVPKPHQTPDCDKEGSVQPGLLWKSLVKNLFCHLGMTTWWRPQLTSKPAVQVLRLYIIPLRWRSSQVKYD